MSKIIDNSDESKILLNEFIIDSNDIDKICILSAFCYYGAFKDIINNEQAKNAFLRCNVQIIIGLNIDFKTYEIYNHFTKENSLENLLEYTISEKNTENLEVIKLFQEKCENKTLEIRQAEKSIHAKLYLFRTNKSSIPNRYIIGSSNFTHRGIVKQRELNIKNYEDNDKAEVSEWFDKEWENATILLNYKNQEKFFDKVLPEKDKNTSLEKNTKTKENIITPQNLYLKTIYEYFSSLENESLVFTPANFGFIDYKYQIDAIKSGIRSIKEYSGVLISDVVGLGKSIIASCIAINLLEKKEINNIIILSPPKISDSWESYSNDFYLKANVISIGKLKDAIKYKKTNSLIIIDEAHRFINSKTKSYEDIKEICFNNKVMLLSATPMHNTTSDIFNLIEIFDNRLIKTENVENIRKSIAKEEQKLKSDYKKDKEKDYKEATKNISKKVIGLINPIIIRRTRKDLLENAEYEKDLLAQDTEFNNVAEPMLHSYDLEALSDIYVNTFNKIRPLEDEEYNEHLKCVRYEPLAYLQSSKEAYEVIREIYGGNINIDFAATSSRNLSGFMRHLLIRRFESSIYAFKRTINNMIERYKEIEYYISRDIYVIDKKSNFSLLEDFIFADDDDFEDDEDNKYNIKLNFKNKSICAYNDAYVIKDIHKVFREEFFEEIKNDLKILEDIRDEWESINIKDDRKFKKLIEKIKTLREENKQRKIIIFSEFKDTVEYLYENIYKDESLNDLFKPIKFTSKDRDRTTIKENFDASYKYQKDEYFLLITTDTLSEGINLHRAGIVINYDIPYNPTRVIQRVGRINRIGKKIFDKIEIHNFIPTAQAQKEVKNWQISNFKLALINAIFGNDTKILQKGDDINALFSLKQENYLLDNEDVSWDSEYRNDYDSIKDDKNIIDTIHSIEDDAAIRREADFNGLLKIIKKNNYLFAVCYEGNGIINYNIEHAFKILKPKDKNEKPFEISDKLDYYENQIIRRINTNSNKINTQLLEDIKLQCKDELSKDDINYIEKLILNSKHLEIYADRINKYLLSKKDVHNIIASLKKLISDDEIDSLENQDNNSDCNNIIVLKEEFSNNKGE